MYHYLPPLILRFVFRFCLRNDPSSILDALIFRKLESLLAEAVKVETRAELARYEIDSIAVLIRAKIEAACRQQGRIAVVADDRFVNHSANE